MANSTAQTEVLVSEELDLAFDDTPGGETVGDVLVSLITHLDVHPECMAIHGSGGGWPTYRFHGTRDALIALYSRYYNAVGVAYGGDYAEAVKRLDDAEPSIL